MVAPASSMRYRTLGRSGLSVSRLCLGSMMFGGPTPEPEAARIVDHAAAAGVNFIDTADQYEQGRSEEVVGRAIRARRHHWTLATKVFNPAGPGRNERGLSRGHIMRAAEDSLRRLGTDTIDLYYVHRPDPATPWESVVASFGALIAAGKIREWGLSNVRAWHIADVAHLCDRMRVPRPVALQPLYNLMNRQIETEVLPAARHFGLGVVPYSPIARGILSGKYQPNVAPAAGTRAGRGDKRMLQAEWRHESLDIAARLKAHADARGIGLVAFAVAWVLNNDAVTSTIAGPRTFEQWTDYFGALSYAWTPEDEALVNSLVGAGHPSTPGHTDPAYPIDGRFPSIG